MSVDWYPKFFGESGQGLLGVVFVGIEQVDFGNFVLPDPSSENFGIAVGAWTLGEPAVEHTVTGLLQGRGMVSHGRVKEREFLLMVA